MRELAIEYFAPLSFLASGRSTAARGVASPLGSGSLLVVASLAGAALLAPALFRADNRGLPLVANSAAYLEKPPRRTCFALLNEAVHLCLNAHRHPYNGILSARSLRAVVLTNGTSNTRLFGRFKKMAGGASCSLRNDSTRDLHLRYRRYLRYLRPLSCGDQLVVWEVLIPSPEPPAVLAYCVWLDSP